MVNFSGTAKRLVVAALFAACVAPTFISYQPYQFAWDDAAYLLQSIRVSRAFWTGNLRGLGAMYGIRPPAMALLGLPWILPASWDAAGTCFVTLAAVISLLAALCLYLLLRIGVKPLFLVAAGLCVLASIGPYPASPPFYAMSFAQEQAAAHYAATAFLADSLFAWTCAAALLLIPYEARTHCPSIRSALLRGILWGSILSLGAMTKISFFYFIVLVLPTLFLIRLRNAGMRGALASLASFACCSAPSALYLVLFGRLAFENARASSFGGVAGFYYVPFLQFLGNVIRESPGLVLSFVLTLSALVYLAIKRPTLLRRTDLLALLIVLGFGTMVLAATNRQIRFVFPAIVALPFLTAILMSDQGDPAQARSAMLAACLAFCGLLAAGVPTLHRASRLSVSRSDAVLAHAFGCNAKRILLLTDSPTLNNILMELALEVSGKGALIKAGLVKTLASPERSGVPIEEDFRAMADADELVLQDRDKLSPPFTNRRVSEYERYVRQGGYISARVWDDVSVYSMRCRP